MTTEEQKVRRAIKKVKPIEVEKEQNIVITDYIFRDKKAGWGSNFCYSYYDNGDKNKIKIKRFPKEGASHEIHCLILLLTCAERFLNKIGTFIKERVNNRRVNYV